MGRLFILPGIAAFIGAMVYMAVMVGGAENEIVAIALETALCQEDEQINQVFGSYEFNTTTRTGGRSTAFFCTDLEGIERDVTLGAIAVIGGGFAALIITGLLFVFIGAGILVRRRTRKFIGQFQNFTVQAGQPTVIDLRDGSYQEGQIPPETMETVQQVLGQFGAIFGDRDDDTLSERLQQLEDARDKGLISESEYQRVRQAILDSMDD